MGNLRAIFWLLGLAVAGPLAAQQTTPAPAGKAAAEAAEAAAAMERAQRLASSPLRVILEASKIRRKGVAADEALPAPAPEAADAASLRRTAQRGADPAAAPAAAKPAAEVAAVATPQPALAVTHNTLAALPQAVSALEAGGQPLVTIAPLPQAAVALGAPLATQPKLVESVEPVFVGRLLDESARLTDVLAELTIRPDGAVVQAVLLGAVPRSLQRPIIAALEQWRFAPLPAQQLHRVQLVFGGSR